MVTFGNINILYYYENELVLLWIRIYYLLGVYFSIYYFAILKFTKIRLESLPDIKIFTHQLTFHL